MKRESHLLPPECGGALPWATGGSAGAVSGGVMFYRPAEGGFRAVGYAGGLPEMTGFSREEYQALLARGEGDPVAPEDRAAVQAGMARALAEGETLHITCRIRRRNGENAWVQFSGGAAETDGGPVLCAALTDVSAVEKLVRQLTGDIQGTVCVVEEGSLDLLYLGGEHEMKKGVRTIPAGEKCYRALHGRGTPCPDCPLCAGGEESEREMTFPDMPGRMFLVKRQRADWQGAPAYILRITDVTGERRAQRELSRLERYYQTLVQNISGGMAVVRMRQDGGLIPEFISEGFAAMTGMTHEEASYFYGNDAMAGVHPQDRPGIEAELNRCLREGAKSLHLVYRLRKGREGYIWTRNNCSLLYDEDGGVTIYSVYTDVTEDIRRQAESRERYEDTLRRYRESIQEDSILTSHSNITQNRVMEALDRTGGRLTERLGTVRDDFFAGLARLIPDEEQRRTLITRFSNRALEEAFRQGIRKAELDCFGVLPGEGQGRYFHMVEELLTAPDTGDLIGVMSIADVTEERLLRLTQQQLISGNYDLITELDLSRGRYRYLRPEGDSGLRAQPEGDLGEKLAEVLGKKVLPRDRAKCARMLDPGYMRRQLAEKGPYTFHYFTAVGGEIRAKSELVFSVDRQLDRVCIARTDITDSIREQQALLRMLAQTFESMAMVAVDTEACVIYTRESILDSQPPLQAGDCAAMAELFLGRYTGEEEQRKDLLHRLSLEGLRSQLRESGDGYSFTAAMRQGEQTLYKQISVTWGSENHQNICLVRRDVTRSVMDEQERAERLQSALFVARDANRAKSDFLSSMSHDIRTPMNAIIGMTDLALAHRDSPGQIDESLRIIKDSAGHLLELVGDILDMSRIESGRLVLRQEPFSHQDRLQMVGDRTRVLAQQRGQTFRCTVNVRHDVCIGDAMRIDQILENLLGNAVKFTPAGGTVTLSVTELASKTNHVGWYRYEVTDSGIGMSEETLRHLYEPFYREDSDRVRGTEGSGLGLSIVKNLVDYRGGVMNVRSEPGKGSTFTVDLPLPFAGPGDEVQFNREEETPPRTELGNCLRGRRLLLVEDHPVNRLVAQRILEDAGAAVTAAVNGAEGLRIFRESPIGAFDAILMDIQMPVMDGYEATRAIRGCGRPGADTVPIVAMTANAFAQDVQKCFNAGMDAHVAKPVDRENFLRTLVQQMSR